MRKRVLILDDDTALLDVLKILLDDGGYDPVLIAYTDDLIGLVRLHQPSLIILDFLLNGRNGGDWCIQLKNDPLSSTIPVMIFTASSIRFDKGKFGCDDFLPKPFDIDDILDRVARLTGERASIVGKVTVDRLVNPGS